MDRQSLPKQQLYDFQPTINNFDLSNSHLNTPSRNMYTQYSPVGRQRSYLSQYSPYRAPRTPVRAFSYDFNHPVFAGDWGYGDYVAVSSFNENAANYIYILHAQHQNNFEFAPVAEAKVTMPQTKVAWNQTENTLLTSGDALRLWKLDSSSNSLKMVSLLAKHSKSQPRMVSAPLTSFDWNKINPSVAITSSIDTTCTVWDLNTQSMTTQLIAHDQEVFDVGFLHHSQHQFVSAGCDGSVRLFDLRSLDNSTIIYESQISTPMLRVAPSIEDPNVIVAFGQDQTSVIVLDIRATRNPVNVLEAHQAPLNSIKWLPRTSSTGPLLATGADDCQLLLWNVQQGFVVGSYNEVQQINNVLTSPDGTWLGSIHGKSIQSISSRFG